MPRLLSLAVFFGIVGLNLGMASAQDYPNKPVRIYTAAAGGGNDFTARIAAQGLSEALGQPVIVDNRTILISAEVVSKAPADGYSLLVGGSSFFIAPLLQTTPYDVIRDFSPISLIERSINVVVVHPSLPVKSVKELIALAKTRPGDLNYGTGSSGGSTHLGVELFKSMAGVNIVAVPYNGNARTVAALISGEVQLSFLDIGLAMPQVNAGKLRALAVSSAEPTTLAPGLPTVAATVPGYQGGDATGIYAPAKTPAAVVNRLNREIVRVVNQPEIKARYMKGGTEPVGNSPEEFAAFLKSDIAKWSKVIKDAGIKAN